MLGSQSLEHYSDINQSFFFAPDALENSSSDAALRFLLNFAPFVREEKIASMAITVDGEN